MKVFYKNVKGVHRKQFQFHEKIGFRIFFLQSKRVVKQNQIVVDKRKKQGAHVGHTDILFVLKSLLLIFLLIFDYSSY
jgi:hypothetical protein